LNTGRKTLEPIIQNVQERIEILERLLVSNKIKKELKEDLYEKGLYKGCNMTLRNELEYLRNIIKFTKTITSEE
jgi:hypothetical protein